MAVSAGGGGGGGGGVPRPFPVLHGCGPGHSHVCLHHGHWEPALPLSRILVRAQCGLRVRGRASSLRGKV